MSSTSTEESGDEESRSNQIGKKKLKAQQQMKRRHAVASSSSSSDDNSGKNSQRKGSSQRRKLSSQPRPSKRSRRVAALSLESEEELSQNFNKLNGGKRTGRTASTSEKNSFKNSNRPKSAKRRLEIDEEVTTDDETSTLHINSVKEMVSQGVFYLLIAHTKLTPIRRAEFSKMVMKGTKVKATVLKEVLQKTQKKLKKIFGILMYGLNETTKEYNLDLTASNWTSYMLVSKFKSIQIDVSQNEFQMEEESSEARKSILFITLSVIFMSTMDQKTGIKEDILWKCIRKLELDTLVNIKEEDFTKFAKTEFSSKLYLSIVEEKDENLNETSSRYFWGPRAEVEYSKLEILLFISKLLGISPTSFPTQYKIIMNSNEKRRAKHAIQAALYNSG